MSWLFLFFQFRLRCRGCLSGSREDTIFVCKCARHLFCQHTHYPFDQDLYVTSARARNSINQCFSSSFKSLRCLPRALFLKLNLTLYFSASFSITSTFLCGLLGKKLFTRDKLRCSDCLLEKELGEIDDDESFWPVEDPGISSIE